MVNTLKSLLSILLILALPSAALSATVHSRANKATPTTSDEIPIEDAAASWASKKTTLGALPISSAVTTALGNKADTSCFASESAFNACFDLTWSSGSFDQAGNYTLTGSWNFSGATVTGLSGGSMVYPGAGVPNSTGSAWETSYTVGTGASNLVQLNASAQLPAVSGVNLTNISYANLTNKPTLGTSAQYDVGTAIGNIVRLTDNGGYPSLPFTISLLDLTDGAGTGIDAPLSNGRIMAWNTAGVMSYVTPVAVDDTPNDNDTTNAPTANWAFDHTAAADPHTGYVLESALGSGVGTFLGTPSSTNLATAVTDETGSGALVFGTNPTFTTSATIANGGKLVLKDTDSGEADSEVTSNDGKVTITAVGGTNNENLSVDLESTANTAILGSSTGLTLITTGSIPLNGAIKVVGKSSDYTIGTDNANEAYGSMFFNTAASTRTFTLPSAVAGMSVCIKNLQGVSQILRLDAATGDYIVKSTGARTSASGEYYGATADAKNQLCVVAYDATDWYVTSEAGTWTEE